ncbi:hypothetical protein ACER0C_001841 [Sarotherodon galilaeus]
MFSLKQDKRSVADFSVEFWTLAEEAGWEEKALRGAFLNGLNERIKHELATKDMPTTLSALVDMCIRLDDHMREFGGRSEESRHPVGSSNAWGHPVPSEWRKAEQEPGDDEEQPMQLGHASFRTARWRKKRQTGECVLCERKGQVVDSCPVQSKEPGSSVSVRVLSGATKIMLPHLSCPAKLIFLSRTHPCEALIDSGAEQSFIDEALARELEIPLIALREPLRVSALNGKLLAEVTHCTQEIQLVLSGNHVEKISLFLFKAPETPKVLGYPWLQQHNPQIDWSHSCVTGWSVKCHELCLKSAVPNITDNVPAEVSTIPDLSNVPSDYHDLVPVFCKDRALSLPPHRPYDCCIDLLPGASLPTSRLYSISKPEREAMERYITDSLASGIIRPSTSPLGAGFFFVEKKDKTLRLCIDFRGLNNITVKNKYPLPLLASAFELLQGAVIFSKLDLRNAYHLVRIREGDEWKTAFNTHLGHFEYLVMPFGPTNAPAVFQAMVNDVLRDFINHFAFVYLDDILIFSKSRAEHIKHVRLVLQRLLANRLFVKGEKCEFHVQSVSFLGFLVEQGRLRADPAKVKAVVEWPEPKNQKAVQKFLGFANFYRRFIRNFSKVVSPLTHLTSPKQQFLWLPAAQRAFDQLKRLFSSAPVLIQADLTQPFIVEVDASDSGVGAVLSQRLEGKLHPCVFFSRRLSQAERNYDVGDRELLAIKLALEEWRHWLEGSEHPVLFGQITRTWPTFKRLNVSMPDKPGGPCFSPVSTLSSLTGQAHATLNPTPSHVNSHRWEMQRTETNPSCLLPVSSGQSPGRSRG